MSTVHWSDGELRRFVLNAPSLGWGEETLAEIARQRFGCELRHRVVPRVQERLLAKVGVPLSSEGLCLFACKLVEDSRYDRRRDWLLLCADPWEYLTEWVGMPCSAPTGRRSAGLERMRDPSKESRQHPLDD